MSDHDQKSPSVTDSPADVDAWESRLRTLPELRWEKIRRIRAAIDQGEYDEEARITEMLNRVENDLGVLCRKENQATDES